MMTTAAEFMTNFNSRHAPEPKKRKSARQQVTEAERELLRRILEELRSGKRSIPKEWERGYYAAMSAVERIEL